jgi:hypothetical protein
MECYDSRIIEKNQLAWPGKSASFLDVNNIGDASLPVNWVTGVSIEKVNDYCLIRGDDNAVGLALRNDERLSASRK